MGSMSTGEYTSARRAGKQAAQTTQRDARSRHELALLRRGPRAHLDGLDHRAVDLVLLPLLRFCLEHLRPLLRRARLLEVRLRAHIGHRIAIGLGYTRGLLLHEEILRRGAPTLAVGALRARVPPLQQWNGCCGTLGMFSPKIWISPKIWLFRSKSGFRLGLFSGIERTGQEEENSRYGDTGFLRIPNVGTFLPKSRQYSCDFNNVLAKSRYKHHII